MVSPRNQSLPREHVAHARGRQLHLILKDDQVGEVNQQVYGKDVNSVLDEIMGVSERPKKVAALFDAFYEYIYHNHSIVAVASTMGPGVKINPNKFTAAPVAE